MVYCTLRNTWAGSCLILLHWRVLKPYYRVSHSMQIFSLFISSISKNINCRSIHAPILIIKCHNLLMLFTLIISPPQWIRAPCLINSYCTNFTSTSLVLHLVFREMAAAAPAAWPVTVQHIMLRVAAWETMSPDTHLPATRRLSTSGTKHPQGIQKQRPELGRMRMLQPSTNSGKTPTESSNRACMHTSSPVKLYLPTILRESRTPSVMAMFRSFASSNPGTICLRAFKALTVPFRPCISASVKCSLFRVSNPLICTRFRLVASPAWDRADHDPVMHMFSSTSFSRPFSSASLNYLPKYGLLRLSSLPVVSCCQLPVFQSKQVWGSLPTWFINFTVSTPATLNTDVTPKDLSRGKEVQRHPAKQATSASPEQSIIL